MPNPKNIYGLIFVLIVWTVILMSFGWQIYSNVTGPNGIVNFRIKTQEEIMNGSP